jgi:protein SCO1/2
VVGLALVTTAVIAWQYFQTPAPQFHGMALDSPSPALDFTLADANGRAVRLSDFRGRIVLLYFGFTYCPDICPATLTDLARAMDALGEQARETQVIMISIDPERDTPQKIRDYAQAFHPDFIGLSGAPEAIAAIAGPFGVYYEKRPDATGENYTMAHTSTVTVIDREGYVRLVWPFGAKGVEMAEDLRLLLR